MRAPILRNLRSTTSASLWIPLRQRQPLASTTTVLRLATNNNTTSTTTSSTSLRAFSSSANAGHLLKNVTQENPHVDVVRYEHKNRKWSLSHVDYYSEALAIGFVENGLRPGDVLLSYLPLHFAESMILQFACSKAGFVLYHLDPNLAETNPATAKVALEAALTLSKANILVTQEATDNVNYISLIEDIIPDIDLFDFGSGKPFVCPQFPHLRFPIHTGFDQEQKWGFLLFRHFLVPSGNLDQHLAGYTLNGNTPLLGQFQLNDKGIPTALAKTLSNDQVIKDNIWPTFTSILKKEFHEVPGVGVVW